MKIKYIGKCVSEITQSDYRKKENKILLQRAMREIEGFEKYKVGEQIPFSKIEQAVLNMCLFYNITPQWISITLDKKLNTHFYNASFKTSDNHAYIESIVATCMYELYAKELILLDALTKGYIPNTFEKDKIVIRKREE